jgi:hypothetical protein
MQPACLKRANAQQATCEVFILGYGAPAPNDGKRTLRLQLRKGCVDVFFDQTGIGAADRSDRAIFAKRRDPRANVARAK